MEKRENIDHAHSYQNEIFYDLKWKMIYFDEILNYMNGSLPVFLVARKCTRSTYPTWPIVLVENMI